MKQATQVGWVPAEQNAVHGALLRELARITTEIATGKFKGRGLENALFEMVLKVRHAFQMGVLTITKKFPSGVDDLREIKSELAPLVEFARDDKTIQNAIYERLNRAFERFGLESGFLASIDHPERRGGKSKEVLDLLREKGPTPFYEVAEALKMEIKDLAEIVGRLVVEGLLLRTKGSKGDGSDDLLDEIRVLPAESAE